MLLNFQNLIGHFMFYYCLFSITVNMNGGCFRVPAASAFLVFPPFAVRKRVILTCSRVKYSDCNVKPKEGEFFVSRILKMEPKGVVFEKPVTVLLSHSLYEHQNFLDFYELIIQNVSPSGLQELKTKRICSIEGIITSYTYIEYEIQLL